MSHYSDEFETEALKVRRYAIGAFAVNTYILMHKESHDAVIVDPGGDVDEVVDGVKSMGAIPKRLLFTHCHIDHVAGAMGMKKAFPEAAVTYHELEQIVADNLLAQSSMFGVPEVEMPKCDVNLKNEMEFMVGRLQFVTFLTPGHTPGSVVFYMPIDKLAFTGDLLFRGSVGRTDFEGGSGTELVKSLKAVTKDIPDEVKLLPGHGKFTTMGVEKASNFYLRIDRYR
jgi:glyoxylase-like metal-dependent hydrolase (beta-lactamase superfamily II)